jgi:Holliday junction DNA helicase RuvA
MRYTPHHTSQLTERKTDDLHMIYSLNGKLIAREAGFIVVECGGVGYKCAVSARVQDALPAIDSKVFIYTYMLVREDAMELYGFLGKDELNCFKLLTSVNGVGAKVGVAILSALTPAQVGMSVAAGDYKTITAANGVGPKLAQRIVLELKDKVKGLGTPVDLGGSDAGAVVPAGGGNSANAVAALTVLGYNPGDAAALVAKFDPYLPTEEIIRLSLREMASRF